MAAVDQVADRGVAALVEQIVEVQRGLPLPADLFAHITAPQGRPGAVMSTVPILWLQALWVITPPPGLKALLAPGNG